MTLTIDLTAEETRRVQTARQKGLDLTALVKGLIAGLPDAPEQSTPGDQTLALLARWREEDATEDAEELECRDADTQEFLTHLESDRLTLPIPEV